MQGHSAVCIAHLLTWNSVRVQMQRPMGSRMHMDFRGNTWLPQLFIQTEGKNYWILIVGVTTAGIAGKFSAAVLRYWETAKSEKLWLRYSQQRGCPNRNWYSKWLATEDANRVFTLWKLHYWGLLLQFQGNSSLPFGLFQTKLASWNFQTVSFNLSPSSEAAVLLSWGRTCSCADFLLSQQNCSSACAADNKNLVTEREGQHQGRIKLEVIFLPGKTMVEINPVYNSPVQQTFEQFLPWPKF